MWEGRGGIFSFSYTDDSKIPAAFKSKKKRKKQKPTLLKQKFHRKLEARFKFTRWARAHTTASEQICKSMHVSLQKQRKKNANEERAKKVEADRVVGKIK